MIARRCDSQAAQTTAAARHGPGPCDPPQEGTGFGVPEPKASRACRTCWRMPTVEAPVRWSGSSRPRPPSSASPVPSSSPAPTSRHPRGVAGRRAPVLLGGLDGQALPRARRYRGDRRRTRTNSDRLTVTGDHHLESPPRDGTRPTPASFRTHGRHQLRTWSARTNACFQTTPSSNFSTSARYKCREEILIRVIPDKAMR